MGYYVILSLLKENKKKHRCNKITDDEFNEARSHVHHKDLNDDIITIHLVGLKESITCNLMFGTTFIGVFISLSHFACQIFHGIKYILHDWILKDYVFFSFSLWLLLQKKFDVDVIMVTCIPVLCPDSNKYWLFIWRFSKLAKLYELRLNLVIYHWYSKHQVKVYLAKPSTPTNIYS